ncbi:N-acetyl-alpha-D-glucosaminyl L-malate synthase [bacterium HR21]|jgi:N-acetyl-alpha-D-glucosaminyl L-malate synthase BshA|nr:N-acetyl-alpha-D-glucosaminyl L-malate synthase [bacterium HR21]
MLHIGIVCYPTYGGSGVVATELGKALARRGYRVHFITYALPWRLDAFHDNIFFHEVELPNYPLFEFQLYSLALAGKLVDVARYERLDILHVHYAIPHAISGYLAQRMLWEHHGMMLPVITTLHGTDITLVGLEPSFYPVVRFSLEHSDAVTAVSSFLAEKTRHQFLIQRPIEVIPNFVDTRTFVPHPNPELRRQFAPQGEYILLHVSNFRPVKRSPDTVRILAEVRSAVPAKLILIGDGPERSEAERLARQLGVDEHVRCLGKQPVTPELLSIADIFLLPSQSESFGLAALEAMSCGVPVVATTAGGIPEVVRHGETGFLAEIGDIDRMARYCLELLSNPKKHQLFRERARQRALEFDTELIVPLYERLYQRVLEQERISL